MASIIKTSINLNEIPKDKIYVGKKGKYLPITITLNDEVDQFGKRSGRKEHFQPVLERLGLLLGADPNGKIHLPFLSGQGNGHRRELRAE